MFRNHEHRDTLFNIKNKKKIMAKLSIQSAVFLHSLFPKGEKIKRPLMEPPTNLKMDTAFYIF